MRVRRPTYMGCSNWNMTTSQTLYFPEVWFSQVILWAGRSLHKFNHVVFPKLSHWIFLKETATPRMMLEPMVSNQDIPLHRYTHLFMVDLGWFLLQFWTPPCWVLWDMSEPRSGPGLREQWAQLGAQRRSRVHEYNKIPERSERLADAALHHSLYSFKFSQPHPGIPNSSEISTRTVETHVTTHVNDCKRWLISKITGRFLELPGVHRCGHPWPEV